MKKLLIALFYILFVMQGSYAYLELAMTRVEEDVTIDVTQIVSKNPKTKKCPSNITSFHFNSTVITQLCFHRDISFTIETLIGDINFNYEVAAIGIDLLSPVSWIKSTECRSCPIDSPIPNYKAVSNLTCNAGCLYNELQTDFIVTNKYKTGKKGQISSDNQLVYGEYIESQFQFLAYNPDKNFTVFRYIEQQFELDSFDKYEDLIKLPSLKMIAANKLIGYDKIYLDGQLGLGAINQKKDLDLEDGVDIFQSLLNAQQDLNQRIFCIYINVVDGIFIDYALILGGIDFKFSSLNSDDVKYVNVIENSGYYWNLPIESISYNVGMIDANLKGVKDPSTFNIIKTEKLTAILSLSNSFIALPKDELQKLVSIINRFGSADCKIVDFHYMAVYCTDLHIDAVQTMELKIKFEGGSEITLDYRHLIRKCNLFPELLGEKTDSSDCLFNIQMSSSNFIILGEPFLKNHYSIFDQDQMRVGFLPASDDSFWIPEFYYEPSIMRYLIRVVIVIFILGMVFIFCISQISQCFKWFKNKWNQDDNYGHASERMSLAQQQQLNDSSFNEYELSARQEALDQLKQQQMQEDTENSNNFEQETGIQEHIQDFSEQNYQQNEIPTIPYPPSSNNNNNQNFLEIEESQQPRQENYDHGFNFVMSGNNNPFLTEE